MGPTRRKRIPRLKCVPKVGSFSSSRPSPFGDSCAPSIHPTNVFERSDCTAGLAALGGPTGPFVSYGGPACVGGPICVSSYFRSRLAGTLRVGVQVRSLDQLSSASILTTRILHNDDHFYRSLVTHFEQMWPSTGTARQGRRPRVGLPRCPDAQMSRPDCCTESLLAQPLHTMDTGRPVIGDRGDPARSVDTAGRTRAVGGERRASTPSSWWTFMAEQGACDFLIHSWPWQVCLRLVVQSRQMSGQLVLAILFV